MIARKDFTKQKPKKTGTDSERPIEALKTDSARLSALASGNMKS
jgi:hypothetical protein